MSEVSISSSLNNGSVKDSLKLDHTDTFDSTVES